MASSDCVHRRHSHPKQRLAFTLVELLVAIGLIALLLSLLLPTFVHVRREAQVIQCAANLHNCGIALSNYADANRGQLPQHAGGGRWLWDLSAQSRDAIMRCGLTRLQFYCPTNTAQNVDGLWDFAVFPAGTTAVPYPPDQTGFGVMGYLFLTKRIDGSFPDPNVIATASDVHWNYQSTLRPNDTAAANGIARASVSSDTELVLEAIIATTTDPPQFGAAHGLFPDTHQSSHWYGKLPLGGNILFMDGHVSWRAFGNLQKLNMKPRCPNIANPANGLAQSAFYW